MALFAIDGHAPHVPLTSWVAPSAELIGGCQFDRATLTVAG